MGGSAMQITTIGLDIAKSVFHIYGVDAHGRMVLKKQLKRKQLLLYMAQLAPCRVAMEACGGAHHWARAFQRLGHEVKLMAPHYVKPYVKSNKNDYNDAEAICEAVQRPTMRFVPVKSLEQQDIQMIHRLRERLVKERTRLVNQAHEVCQRLDEVMGIGPVTASALYAAAGAAREFKNGRHFSAWLGLVPR